jgi:ketosteroid isomerase-like protein
MPKTGSASADAVRKCLFDCYKAWNLLDTDRLAPFYSKEPGVVIFNDVEPVKFEGWEEFKEGESKIMSRTSTWKVQPKDVRGTTWGDVAVSTATPILTGESKAGKSYNLTIRHTAVWERKGGRWLIIHEHWSIPWPSS